MPEFRPLSPREITEYSATARKSPLEDVSLDSLSRVATFDWSKVNPVSWLDLVVRQANDASSIMFKTEKLDRPLPQVDYPRNAAFEDKVLTDIYNIQVGLTAQPTFRMGIVPMQYLDRQLGYYRRLTDDIRRRKQHSVIGRVRKILENREGPFPALPLQLLEIGLFSLSLAVGEPGRFLVGLKDGTYFKKMDIATEDPDPENLPLIELVAFNIRPMNYIGRRELAAIPDVYSPMNRIAEIAMPAPAKSLEELLEEAYFNQRYIVHPEGSEIRFRKAGDLVRMVLVQSEDQLLAKVSTSKGDGFVSIDLSSAAFDGADRAIRLAKGVDKPLWATIAAETYRDLVTAVELPIRRFKPLRSPSTPAFQYDGERLLDNQPQVIYIPRTTRVKEYVEPRAPYEGPPRPMKPHFVSPHKRRGNMSEKQREELRKIEKKFGIKFVDNIPEGHTFVRRHSSPKGEEVLQDLPIFIKRRIETEIKQALQLPEVSKNSSSN